ncbi:MAG: DUF4292 domain-containing protein [bacterium]|nr:DUF4292 domain-containing protein [bacterium]
MVRRSSGVRSFCLLLALLLTGCPTPHGPWQTLPPPATILSTAEPVWQRLAARRHLFRNLKGLAQVRFESPEQRLTIRDMVVVLQGFDALRLEGIGPLGQPLFLMVARDTRFSLYMPRQARLISGTASAENLSRLFGLAVSPAVLRYVLIGDVPVAPFPTTGEFRYLPDHNLYVWAGHVPKHLHDYRIWFEPYGLNPVRFEIVQPPENVLLRVQYGDFRRLHNMTVPYRITIAQPLTEHRVVWHYREVQLNVEAPSSLFRVTVPVGTERIELD